MNGVDGIPDVQKNILKERCCSDTGEGRYQVYPRHPCLDLKGSEKDHFLPAPIDRDSIKLEIPDCQVVRTRRSSDRIATACLPPSLNHPVPDVKEEGVAGNDLPNPGYRTKGNPLTLTPCIQKGFELVFGQVGVLLPHRLEKREKSHGNLHLSPVIRTGAPRNQCVQASTSQLEMAVPSVNRSTGYVGKGIME